MIIINQVREYYIIIMIDDYHDYHKLTNSYFVNYIYYIL